MNLDEALRIARDENDPAGLSQAVNVLAPLAEAAANYCELYEGDLEDGPAGGTRQELLKAYRTATGHLS